jgi:hypothetical protein
MRQLAPHLSVRRLALDDAGLRVAYGGAHALLYPSKYEGFGMPPLECMACGTPAIVCRNSALPEVLGDAALYVDESNPAGMAEAVVRLFDTGLRTEMVERGLAQAAKFSFAAMAGRMADAMTEVCAQLQAGRLPRPAPVWGELRTFQRKAQSGGMRDDHSPIIRPQELELHQARRTIEDMRKSPFWKAREFTVRVMHRTGLR